MTNESIIDRAIKEILAGRGARAIKLLRSRPAADLATVLAYECGCEDGAVTEREACAVICDEHGLSECAKKIRERGKKQ